MSSEAKPCGVRSCSLLDKSSIVLYLEKLLAINFENGCSTLREPKTYLRQTNTYLGYKIQHVGSVCLKTHDMLVENSPNLKQHLRTHTKKAIHNPECKNQRHAIYKSTAACLVDCTVLGQGRIPTSSRTREARRLKAARPPSGSAHGSWANICGRVIQRRADPAVCHTSMGCAYFVNN